MDAFPVNRAWELVLSGRDSRKLTGHLFPGDHQEHGAILLAGVHVLRGRVRLLVRDVILARDHIDHVPGKRGSWMLTAQFIRPHLLRARDEKLVYFSVHNHGGDDRVAFSGDDVASHERGYPALLDIVQGMPVGAVVFAPRAVAADLWLPNGKRVGVRRAIVVGSQRICFYPEPPKQARGAMAARFSRQVLMFGETGQRILRDSKVAIVGLGGIGSQLAELLSRLGVGHFVLIDPDRADVSNLPRLVASRSWDVLVSEATASRWGMLRPLLDRLRRQKVDLAARNIRRANHAAKIERVFGSVVAPENAARLLDCDFIFLAADQMSARLVFNAILHQYLIPGVQVGARVVANWEAGEVTDVFAVSRPVGPDVGCLWCNGLIDATKLQLEATEQKQAALQRYGTESPAPSVMTLNALAAADAANLFQFYMTGLATQGSFDIYRRYHPLRGGLMQQEPRHSLTCPECGRGTNTRFGKGDGAHLPTVPGA
jgi:hypothetical protein